MKKRLLSILFIFAGPMVSKAQGDLKTYNNYDFVPGEDILFEDNFSADQSGEFAAHWNLKSGQGVVNTTEGKTALILTSGNFAKVTPMMKNEIYLTDPGTIEFDFFMTGYPPIIFFKAKDRDSRSISLDYRVSTNNFDNTLSEAFPDGTDASFKKKWHHAAIAYKNGQMKIYIDQYRVLVIPQTGFVPQSIALGGIASKTDPVVISNVRIAAGGSMNMLNKILTDGKFVTHAITFDVNKAVIKPASMGFLNSLVKFLQENKSIKLEIDGYTDNDGSHELNAKLSTDRAEAVKAQLVAMGIDAPRLSTKGFGGTKPIADNTTPEGKANNRRVEFIKM